MIRFCTAAALVALIGWTPAWADEKKDQPLKGTWVKEVEGGAELAFQFKTKDELIIVVTAGDNGCTLTCKYEADKNGKVKARVTDVKEKGEFPSKPAVGYEFKCVFKIDGETAKLSDFEAENADMVRAIVEGEYKKKATDK